MTDRRAALNEVHQSMHEEYHGTIRREDIIRLAREAGASSLHGGEVALFGGDAIERFAALVAAEKDKEIKRLQNMLKEQLGELTALRAEKQMRTRIEQLKEQPR